MKILVNNPFFSSNLSKKYVFVRKLSNKTSFKVLFLGSDSIALSSLRKINELRSDKIISCLDLVTANNSKNKTVIEKFALNENLKTISWPLVNLRNGDYDVGLIVAFGHLIKDEILSKFPLGIINVHPSLLPRWRGAAPIIHTLLHGDQVTGVTLMKIKPDIFDVGEVISQQRVQITPDVKQPELTEQLSNIGAEMLVKCMRDLPYSLDNAKPQSTEGVTYAKKINKSISEVKWSEMSAVQVYNLHRAIYGIYPLTTKFRDKQIKLFDAFLVNDNKEQDNRQVGTIDYCDNANAVKVLCKDRRYVYFKSLRIVGKKEITALDFYNGYIKNVPKDKRKYVLNC